MIVIRLSLAAMLAATALVTSTASANELSLPVAVTNATLVPKPGQVIEDATIVLDSGRIQAAGPNAEIPPTARIVDVRGMYVYPGFIDAINHIGIADEPPSEQELARLRETEIDAGKGPRTGMQRANRKGIWPHRTIRDIYAADDGKLAAYRKAGFTTALISPRPAILGGQGDVVQLGGSPLRAATLATSVTQIAAFSGNISPTARDRALYPSSRLGIVALMRQTYMDAQWYRGLWRQYESHPRTLQRPPHDPVLQTMTDLLDRKQRWFFLADSAPEIHHALNLAREFNQDLVIVGAKDAWKAAERLAAENVPVIVSPNWSDKPKFAPDKKRSSGETLYTTQSWTPDWEDDFFEPLTARQERVRAWVEEVTNIRALLDAGVPLALTTRDLRSPDNLWKNIQTAIEYGLTEDELLAMLTTAPAQLLGVSEQIGAVEPGKLANLAVFTHPIGHEDAAVRHVFVEGEQFDFTVTLKPKKDDAKEEESEHGESDAGDSAEEDSEEAKPDDEEEAAERIPHRWAVERQADRDPPRLTNGNVLLRNAHVITVAGDVQMNTGILVQNGQIQSLGRDLEAPAGTTVFDLTGYWIMPGVIDPHSHMAASSINEGTSSITCEVRIADVIDHTQITIHRALAGGVTTIHTMHGSANSIGGQNAVMKLKYNTSPSEMLVSSGPRIVKFALGENVTRTRSVPRFPNSRMGVESVMRQAFTDALEYQKRLQRYAFDTAAGLPAQIPRRDLRLEALSDILQGNIWVHSHCYRADEILRLLDVASTFGFRIATLQHVLEGYRVAPEMLNHGVGGSTFSDWWGFKQEAYNAIPYNAAMMARAGVLTSLNSDSADTIRYMPLEAAKTIRFGGLTADEAIRLVTLHPAIQIGLDDRIGSIEPGKDADLAVFDRHPLNTFAKNVMTLIEGEVWFVHRDIDLDDIAPGPNSTFVPEPPREPMNLPASGNNFYAITGATVHPVSGPPIENGVVVMRNGLITAVGQDFTPPAEATLIDARGLHVYPGLVNAFTQIGLTEISSQSETSDFRDIGDFQPELRGVSAVNPFSAHVGVARAEGIATTGAFPLGGYIAGRGGLIQLDGWSMPEMLRKNDLGLVINLPSVPSSLTGDARKRRMEEHENAILEIERFIQQARHYLTARENNENIPDDVRLAAMDQYLNGDGRVFFRASSYKQIMEAITFAQTFNLRPVIVGGGEAWKCADLLAELQIPVIVTDVYSLPYSPFEPWDAFYANPAKLEKAGVPFCIATDGSAYARRLPLHAGMAVAHGLTPDRAVRAITLDAARILGVDDFTGSLEVGKTADIIITTGHPCQASTRTIGMFLNGNPTPLTSLHEEHHERWNNRPTPELTPPGELRGPSPMRLSKDKFHQ